MNSKGKWIRLTQHLNRFPEVSSGHFPWYPECDVPFPICGNEGGWLESCSPTLWKLVRRQAVCMMRSSSEVVHLIRWLLEFKWVKKGDHLKISRWLRGVRAHHSFIHSFIHWFIPSFVPCLFVYVVDMYTWVFRLSLCLPVSTRFPFVPTESSQAAVESPAQFLLRFFFSFPASFILIQFLGFAVNPVPSITKAYFFHVVKSPQHCLSCFSFFFSK